MRRSTRYSAEKLVFDYLGRVAEAARRVLPKGDRHKFVVRIQASIAKQIGHVAAADPDETMRVLTGLGDPAVLAKQELERLERDGRGGLPPKPVVLWKPKGSTTHPTPLQPRTSSGRGRSGRKAAQRSAQPPRRLRFVPGRTREYGPAEPGRGQPGPGVSGSVEPDRDQLSLGAPEPGEPGHSEPGRSELDRGETGRGETGRGEFGRGEFGPGEPGRGGSGASLADAAWGQPAPALSPAAPGPAAPGPAGLSWDQPGAAESSVNQSDPAEPGSGDSGLSGSGLGACEPAGSGQAGSGRGQFTLVPGLHRPKSGPLNPSAGGPPPVQAVLALVRSYPWESIAVVLIGVGGLIYPFPLWLIGGLVALLSRLWDTRDKWIALVGPLALALIGLAFLAALDPGNHNIVAAYIHTVARGIGVMLRVGAVICAAYLAWRVWRGPRSKTIPPWMRSR